MKTSHNENGCVILYSYSSEPSRRDPLGLEHSDLFFEKIDIGKPIQSILDEMCDFSTKAEKITDVWTVYVWDADRVLVWTEAGGWVESTKLPDIMQQEEYEVVWDSGISFVHFMVTADSEQDAIADLNQWLAEGDEEMPPYIREKK